MWLNCPVYKIMPNWCSTTVRFVGSKEDCEAAQVAIKEICSRKNAGWLGYINCILYPEQRPFDKFEERINLPVNDPLYSWSDYPIGDCRGWFHDKGNIYQHTDKSYILDLLIEDAWGPHPEILQLFGLKYNLSLNYSYEEPMMQEFGIYDVDGVFDDYTWFADIFITYDTGEHFSYIGPIRASDICTFAEMPDEFKQFVENNKLELNEDNIELIADQFAKTLPANDQDQFIIGEYEPISPKLPTRIPTFEEISTTKESL